MEYSFYHSSFYLYSIPFITPASIFTVFVTLLQLLFKFIIKLRKHSDKNAEVLTRVS